MSLYIIASVVIYRYVGLEVTSPALGSAGPLIARIAYGVALPTVREVKYQKFVQSPNMKHNRLLLPVSLTAMSLLSHFTFGYLPERTICTSATLSLLLHG